MSSATETSVTCPPGHSTSIREASFHPVQAHSCAVEETWARPSRCFFHREITQDTQEVFPFLASRARFCWSRGAPSLRCRRPPPAGGSAQLCQRCRRSHMPSPLASPLSFQAHGICIRITQFSSVCTASNSLELTNTEFIVDSTLLSYAQACSAVYSKKQEETIAVTSCFPYSSSD